MKKVLLCLIFLLACPLWAVDYDLFDELLTTYTSEVRLAGINTVALAYPALKKDKRFNELVSDFENTDPAALGSESNRLAFWINAYNVFAIKLALDNYPITSIKDTGDVYNPFGRTVIARINGKGYSLDDIKHNILRKQFNQPLIHTALCTASISGPDLRREAYRPRRIRQQLRDQLTSYLSNDKKGFFLDRENKTLYLASLFTWDAEDFKKWGGIINFLEKFISPEDHAFLDSNRYKIKYFDYNWDLNVKLNGPEKD